MILKKKNKKTIEQEILDRLLQRPYAINYISDKKQMLKIIRNVLVERGLINGKHN